MGSGHLFEQVLEGSLPQRWTALSPENDQLIDISGTRWCSCTMVRALPSRTTRRIVHRSKINPLHVWKRDHPFSRHVVG